MNNPICAASYERAVELRAAGCLMPYADSLPHLLALMRSFHAEQLYGDFVSRVYVLGPLGTCYVIALRVGTERPSGTVIVDWSFKPPWRDDSIDWNCEPEDVIPERDRDEYRSLFKSRLMKTLNGRQLISRGHPVDGLLCGRSPQAIRESFQGEMSAELSFTDDLGKSVPLPIQLTIDRTSEARANRVPVGGTRRRVFTGPRDFEVLDQVGKPEEALPDGRERLEMAEAVGDAEAIQTDRTRLTDAGQ